jgi:hypothetical protein
MFIGEGVTMASEAAILGTRAVCINTPHPVYFDLEETYGLICNFISGNGVLRKVTDMLADETLKPSAIANSRKMLQEKIDVTAFMVWFIENYPDSIRIIKDDPGYHEGFKSQVAWT